MHNVELTFDYNIKLATENKNNVFFKKHKGYSDSCLSKLLAEHKKNYFDLVYIDGSHQASNVLCDAVLGFRLLKIGGYMFFDDYLWTEDLPHDKDPIKCPKIAIDAFTNIYYKKLHILRAPLYQFYIQKIAD